MFFPIIITISCLPSSLPPLTFLHDTVTLLSGTHIVIFFSKESTKVPPLEPSFLYLAYNILHRYPSLISGRDSRVLTTAEPIVTVTMAPIRHLPTAPPKIKISHRQHKFIYFLVSTVFMWMCHRYRNHLHLHHRRNNIPTCIVETLFQVIASLPFWSHLHTMLGPSLSDAGTVLAYSASVNEMMPPVWYANSFNMRSMVAPQYTSAGNY